jgi:hypothetical protein
MASRWIEIADPWLPSNVPSVAACYCIYCDGQLMYVGQSTDLHSRILSHISIPGYSNILQTPWGCFIDVTVKYKPSRRYGDWLMDEARLIRRLQPSGNQRGSRARSARANG